MTLVILVLPIDLFFIIQLLIVFPQIYYMNQNFVTVLRENVEDYTGEHKEIICQAPNLYELACKLLHGQISTHRAAI